MLLEHLKLVAEDGNELHLFNVQPGDEWFTCDAYIALYDEAEGTVFYGRDPKGKRVPVRCEQAINPGLWIYPGDPQAFGQLIEQPLFRQLGDDDGSTQAAEGH